VDLVDGDFDHARGGRRAFLGVTTLSLLAVALGPRRAAAAARDPRRLRMLNAHTGERLDIAYFERGGHLPEALAELDRFLRDFRTGEVHPIDPGVLDLAWSLARAVDRPLGMIEIISGYRSPETNAILRARSGGVAVHSLHLEGRAIDLRMPGVATERLRDAALLLARGGVGFYAASDFLHVDTGRVRRW
jgi:uncharacterized protein YcbK (DUF882 family)